MIEIVNTSYFSKQKKMLELGYELVSISRSTPDWFVGQIATDLQPSWELIHGVKNGTMSTEEYTLKYREQVLSKLDPKDVYDTLKGRVMCCWENTTKFCHRHIVANWLKEHGYPCEELAV